jgi:hypothetical protein
MDDGDEDLRTIFAIAVCFPVSRQIGAVWKLRVTANLKLLKATKPAKA